MNNAGKLTVIFDTKPEVKLGKTGNKYCHATAYFEQARRGDDPLKVPIKLNCFGKLAERIESVPLGQEVEIEYVLEGNEGRDQYAGKVFVNFALTKVHVTWEVAMAPQTPPPAGENPDGMPF